ncbi:MAG: flagellar biosynthesis protein FlhA [Polyangiales bacterium]
MDRSGGFWGALSQRWQAHGSPPLSAAGKPERGSMLADTVLAGVVILILVMMVVPLPTWLLDQLIALNLAMSLLLLITALYIPQGVAFSSLPSVLLITTLYRLALIVSSTRLILLQADAGHVIRAFGEFVVRGDYLVGAVVFLIVSLIQYIVVAKGGERVAEVAARFSLDAMPGKQLAIDADLRAGALRPDAAQTRRAELERESRFYGAMDGALKFVKGDAIASLVIVAIAFVGGTALGYWQRGLPLTAALQLYGLLAIGDGLVSQLPALIMSTAAGLTVTRVAAPQAGSLGQEVGQQLLARPRALFAVAASLVLLALVPGFPALPFVLLAALAVFGGLRVGPAPAAHSVSAPPALTLALDPQLSASAPSDSELLLSITSRLASETAARLGVPAPSVGRAALPPWAASVSPTAASNRELTLFLHGAPLWHDTAASSQELQTRLAAELPRQLARRARELLGLDACQQLLDALATHSPRLVQHVVPRLFSLPQLTEILRRLLDEQVSLQALPRILEALVRCERQDATLDRGLALAREAVRDQLSARRTQRDVLHVHPLDPLIEDALRDATHTVAGERVTALAPELALDVVRAVHKARTTHGDTPVLVTQPDIRRSLYEVLRDELPEITVLAYHELPALTPVERRELISP